jgi:flagellar motor switch protein FliN/FliY
MKFDSECFSQRADSTSPHWLADKTGMPQEYSPILELEVPLIVQIASRTMAVKEVMELEHGAIIEFPRSADEELEILVNNKSVGLGTAVKVGENFGVRISGVGGLESCLPQPGSSNPKAAPSRKDQAP